TQIPTRAQEGVDRMETVMSKEQYQPRGPSLFLILPRCAGYTHAHTHTHTHTVLNLSRDKNKCVCVRVWVWVCVVVWVCVWVCGVLCVLQNTVSPRQWTSQAVTLRTW